MLTSMPETATPLKDAPRARRSRGLRSLTGAAAPGQSLASAKTQHAKPQNRQPKQGSLTAIARKRATPTLQEEEMDGIVRCEADDKPHDGNGPSRSLDCLDRLSRNPSWPAAPAAQTGRTHAGKPTNAQKPSRQTLQARGRPHMPRRCAPRNAGCGQRRRSTLKPASARDGEEQQRQGQQDDDERRGHRARVAELPITSGTIIRLRSIVIFFAGATNQRGTRYLAPLPSNTSKLGTLASRGRRRGLPFTRDQ